LLRPIAFRIISRIGLRKGAIIGTFLYSGLGLIMSFIHAPDYLFVSFLAYFALCDVFYWFSYHTYFSILSDGHHRGQEVCARETLLVIAGAFAPALGGLLIQYIGFLSAGVIAGLATLTAAYPLFLTPEVKLGKQMSFKAAFLENGHVGFKLWMGWSILYHMFPFAWAIIIFYLAGSFSLFGGLLSLEVVFSAMVLTIVGRLIDRHRQSSILAVSVPLIIITALFRIYLVDTIYLIIVSDFMMAFAIALYKPILITNFYSYCKTSRNHLWYMLFGEWGWDVGAMLSLSAASLLLAHGTSLRSLIFLSFVGLAITYAILRKIATAKYGH
jgi:MFS family permease